jgi:predicted Zn-dependent protease with MMP-like domain
MVDQPQALSEAAATPGRNPSLDEIHALATAALAELPKPFRTSLGQVVIRIAEWPEDEVLREMGIRSRYGLLGLYHGIALPERGANDPAAPIEMIFLYRRPLLAYWHQTGYDLADIVRNTLVHEIGHHFGLSDADMDALEAEAERDDQDRG